eukprot:5415736-Prymnesium_polylepis.2
MHTHALPRPDRPRAAQHGSSRSGCSQRERRLLTVARPISDRSNLIARRFLRCRQRIRRICVSRIVIVSFPLTPLGCNTCHMCDCSARNCRDAYRTRSDHGTGRSEQPLVTKVVINYGTSLPINSWIDMRSGRRVIRKIIDRDCMAPLAPSSWPEEWPWEAPAHGCKTMGAGASGRTGQRAEMNDCAQLARNG